MGRRPRANRGQPRALYDRRGRRPGDVHACDASERDANPAVRMEQVVGKAEYRTVDEMGDQEADGDDRSEIRREGSRAAL